MTNQRIAQLKKGYESDTLPHLTEYFCEALADDEDQSREAQRLLDSLRQTINDHDGICVAAQCLAGMALAQDMCSLAAISADAAMTNEARRTRKGLRLVRRLTTNKE